MSATRRTPTSHKPRVPARAGDEPRWTAERIRALGVATDLRTAARIFGLSANTAYELARRGEFPVQVIRAGRQYRVSVAGILAVLDAAAEPAPPVDIGPGNAGGHRPASAPA